jgi:hypothetical protein
MHGDDSKASGTPLSPAIKDASMLEIGFATVSALTAEGMIWWLVLAARLGILVGAALHVALIALLCGWIRRLARTQQDLRMPLLLTATSAVLGPIGPAGVLLTIGLQHWFTRSALTFESWYASLFPEETSRSGLISGPPLPSSDEETSGTINVVPFMDILSFGTRQQKQSMIALMTSRFQPAFAPVLRKALNDSNNAIRVQAATATTKVENNFLERSMQLADAAKKNPHSPAVLLDLARHYDAYAFAGILDEKRERENRDKAIAAYRGFLELKPEDLTVKAELGRLLVRTGDFAQAIALLHQAIEDRVSSPQIVLWYMESLYSLGRYEELCRLTPVYQASIETDKELPVEVGEALKLWASRHVLSAPGEVATV